MANSPDRFDWGFVVDFLRSVRLIGGFNIGIVSVTLIRKFPIEMVCNDNEGASRDEEVEWILAAG